MAATYTIFGKQVGSHVLSMLTLGTAAGIAAWPRQKTEAPKTETNAPPAPVSTSNGQEEEFDLEKFINDISKEESK